MYCVFLYILYADKSTADSISAHKKYSFCDIHLYKIVLLLTFLIILHRKSFRTVLIFCPILFSVLGDYNSFYSAKYKSIYVNRRFTVRTAMAVF
jgi:hypothetical protein